MKSLRVWMALSWIGFIVVMFAGSFLLQRFASLGDGPFQAEWLRAGHAHGGVLMLMSLLYYLSLDHTSLSLGVKRSACAVLFAGIVPNLEDSFFTRS